MIAALAKLNERRLLERFLREVATASYDGSENAVLLAAISALGDAKAATVFSALVSARMPHSPDGCAELLLALSGTLSHHFSEVAAAAFNGLDHIGASDSDTGASEWQVEEDEAKRPLDPQFLENLLRALQHFNGGVLCIAAIERSFHARRYSVP